MGTTSPTRNFYYCVDKIKKLISAGEFPSNTHIRLEVAPCHDMNNFLRIAVCDAYLPDGTTSLSFKCLCDRGATNLKYQSVYTNEDPEKILCQMLEHTRRYPRATETETRFDEVIAMAGGLINNSRDIDIKWRIHPIFLDIQSRRGMIFAGVEQP